LNNIGKRVLRGAFWLAFSKIFHLFLAGVTIIFIARWLGPDNYGYIPLVASIIGLSMVFADAGVAPSTARFLAEIQGNEHSIWSLLKRTFKLRLFILMPLCLGLYLTIDWLAKFLNAPLLPKFGWLIALLLFLQTMQRWIAKVCEGTGNIDFLGKVNLSINWTKPTLQVALVLAGLGLLGFFVGQAVAYFLIIGVFFFLLIKKFYSEDTMPGKVEPIVSKSHIISYALPLMVIHASFFLYMQSDILMLKYFKDIQEVSFYGIATRMATLIVVPVAAFGASAAPLVLVLKKDSIQRAREMIFKSLKYLIVIYTFVSLVIFIYANEIVEILFSARYLSSAAPLKIYSIFIFFLAISSFVSFVLDYSGLAKIRMILVATSAGLNVLLNLILIPKYGMIGAAWATQITYSPLVMIYIWLIAKHYQLLFFDIFKMLINIVTIGLITLVILYLFHSFWDKGIILRLLGIPLGGSLYLYMTYKMSLVKKDELLALFGGKFRK